jgi:hypothetical protein
VCVCVCFFPSYDLDQIMCMLCTCEVMLQISCTRLDIGVMKRANRCLIVHMIRKYDHE